MEKNQEIQNLEQKVERMKVRIKALKEEEQSESVDHGASIIGLRQLIENYPKKIDTKEKEVTVPEKQAKNKDKAKKKLGKARQSSPKWKKKETK